MKKSADPSALRQIKVAANRFISFRFFVLKMNPALHPGRSRFVTRLNRALSFTLPDNTSNVIQVTPVLIAACAR